MNFRIHRTSDSLYPEKPPCEESYKDNEEYYIEISSLEDLIDFADKHGDLVISRGSIEIYDTYRE